MKKNILYFLILSLLLISCNKLDYDLLNTHVSNMQAYLDENKVELENKNITYEEIRFTNYIKTYSLLEKVDFEKKEALYDIFTATTNKDDKGYYVTTYIYESNNSIHYLIDENGSKRHEIYENSNFIDHLVNYKLTYNINTSYLTQILNNYPKSEEYKIKCKGNKGKLEVVYYNKKGNEISDTNGEKVILSEVYLFSKYLLSDYVSEYQIDKINYKIGVEVSYFAEVKVPSGSSFLQ